ncbi:MAG: sugar ABC transporter permease [Planctomycetes bacterium]|nr:sugar ABC transporter permease [Planctomycetota bacterium]
MTSSNESHGVAWLNKKTVTHIVMLVGIVAMVYIFNHFTRGVFASPRNLTLLTKQGSVLMIVACGLMLLLVERNFDLSGGAAVYFVSVVVSKMVVTYKIGIAPSIAVALACGLLLGCINGIFIGYVAVPAFIATLASQLVFKGVGYTWTDAATIGPIPDRLADLAEGYIPNAASGVLIIVVCVLACFLTILNFRKMRAWYGGANRVVGELAIAIAVGVIAFWVYTGYHGIPMCVLFAVIMIAITSFIANKSVFGRHIYIIGGNPEAARLVGIKTKRRVFQSYLYMGLIYGVAGVVITARLGGSTATTANLIELDAVAAACIGGTSMSGGVGTVGGVALGVLILSAVDNVMSLMNISSYAQMVVKGLILLFAVCMDVYVNRSTFKLVKSKKQSPQA